MATATDVGCPQCQDRFKISPEFLEALAECPKCQCEFVIKPPVAPPDQSAGSGKTDTSKLDRPAPSESKLKPPSASPASAEARLSSAPRPPGVTGVPAPPAEPATPPEPDASPEPDAALETAVKSAGKGRNKTVLIVTVVVVLVIAVGGYFAWKMFM